jgi:hypothetical protein
MNIMNRYRTALTAVLAVAPLVAVAPASAQIVANPQVIQGNARFINSNPAVLAILGAPGNEGMSNLTIFATSLPPAPRLDSFALIPNSGRLNAPFQITVESDPVGYAYEVAVRAQMADASALYWFRDRIAPPVTPSGGPVVVNPEECAAVVDLRFVDAAGTPVTISGGSVRAFNLPESSFASPQAQQTFASGVTQTTLIVRGGEPTTITTTVDLGTRTETDRIQFQTTTNLLAVCDAIQRIDVVVPTPDRLGRMVGDLDLLGEFELTIDGSDELDRPDASSVIAFNGPFGNSRYAPLPGVNFTTPSSGPFTVGNLLPDNAAPGSAGYTVYARTYFRTGDRFATFDTPSLGFGSNPPVVVAAANTVNLSNLFVINPGYLRGNIRLKGPVESGGRASMLRGVRRASDDDSNHDGVPDRIGTYGIYWSDVSAVGVNRRAAGARFTAARGYSAAVFAGSFDSGTSEFNGNYDLLLGGLGSERSIWRQETMTLSLTGGSPTGGDFYSTELSVRDLTAPEREIGPGQTLAGDLACCFGEVFIQIRSSSGLFYDPQIRFSSGTFTGTDFVGRPANYRVDVDPAFGAPTLPSQATNVGYIRLLLPQGSYSLNAYVVPAGTSSGRTQIDRFNVDVGCGQIIRIEQCLQLALDTPACVDSATPTIRGNVRSCTNVTRIAYRVNAGPEANLCTDCGVNPAFAFTPTLPVAPCGSANLTVTAYDAGGATSFVTTSLRLDNQPPDIQCPADIRVDCASGSAGTPVDYTVRANDDCPGTGSLVCNPPSGTVFPPGTNTVLCVARDTCRNTSQCSFKVVVINSDLAIERAVILRWNCGVLQSATRPEGPYTDVIGATSPYCTPSDRVRLFYRVRP